MKSWNQDYLALILLPPTIAKIRMVKGNQKCALEADDILGPRNADRFRADLHPNLKTDFVLAKDSVGGAIKKTESIHTTK